MKKLLLSIIMLVLFTSSMMAQQFDLSAEIRPRLESRHGYKKLVSTDTDGANFISQRTRLNFNYKQEKLKLGVSLQNVRVWGDVSTLSSADNLNSLHEAWAEAILSDKFSMKLGRQEIVYDDHRIFGSVGWAQQARSHDALLLKVKPADGHKLDIGLAMNADSQGLTNALYSNAAGYKNFQYAWYHGDFDKLGVSFLALNTGLEYIDTEQTVSFMQTIGPRFTYKSGKLSANAASYYQTGNKGGTDVNALYYAVNLGYKASDNFSLGLGYESLSGNDMDDANGVQNAFAPLFGTNHKFNGWMDYFYVGNHGGSVGLNDISATVAYKNGKFSAKLIPHLFTAAGNVYNGVEVMDAKLGTEIDFVMGYAISKNIKFNMGYSHMIATESMEVLKGGDMDARNNWGWVMFTFKPKLFSTATK